eukprot:TRINITY_DN874_c0_g1_i7.p1 TRINITY_DN874_c0_g1~~TRINITY_DN874_c0_g1_i7.p1  ORF type:complete len:157 (-),score=18.13 TRINITY_DN874_c0_g1_i7:367-837(-)
MNILEFNWSSPSVSRVDSLLPRDLTSQESLISYSADSLEERFTITLNFGEDVQNILTPMGDLSFHIDTSNQIAQSQQKECRPLPKDIRKKIKIMKVGKTKKECSICVCAFAPGEIIRELPCKHIYHHKCIKPWFATSSSCPNCRSDIEAHFRGDKY